MEKHALMDILDKGEKLLAEFHGLQYVREPLALRVAPPNPNGFPVALEIDKDGYVVRLGGWHEAFLDETDALECFAFGFSPGCRLRVTSRGKQDIAWALEFKNGPAWEEYSNTEQNSYQIWRSKETRYLHNILPE
jgi:hypothetical protein